jgi:myo-inositol-1(or 4)-monophosphatase
MSPVSTTKAGDKGAAQRTTFSKLRSFPWNEPACTSDRWRMVSPDHSAGRPGTASSLSRHWTHCASKAMYAAAAAPPAAAPPARRLTSLLLCSRPAMLSMVPRRGMTSGMVNADMDTRHPSDDATVGLRRRLPADEEQWLACAARMAAAGKTAAQPLYGTAAGRTKLGQGAGGDHTLEIDRACEAAIHEVLAAEAPHAYRLVSEESGIAGPEDAPWFVVVDPVDGSLNAKHGLQPFGASIAVARGSSLVDIRVGYIEDYVRPQAFAAVKGAGLLLAGPPQEPLGPPLVRATPLADPQRFESDLVELVLLEAGRPDRHTFRFADLSAVVPGRRSEDMRVRQIGSIALSLCYLAIGVADVLVAAVRARSVDLAAGFLILAEAGGGVAALDDSDVWAQSLDLEKRSAFVAWRAGLDGAEIVRRARRPCSTLLFCP